MTKINYGHNSIVIENVLSMVRGETMTRMYKGTTDIMAISIGRVSILPRLQPTLD